MECDVKTTIKLGDKGESLNFGSMEVICEPYASGTTRKDKKVDVRFDNTGFVRKGVLTAYFKAGAVVDGSVQIIIQPGMKFKSNKDGDAEVVGYENSKNVVIQFIETGNVQSVQLYQLLTGLFSDRGIKKLRSDKLRQKEAKKQAAILDKTERRNKNKEHLLRKRKERQSAAQARRENQARIARAKIEHEAMLEQNRIDVITPADVGEVVARKPSKYVLDVDFKDRDGKWVLRFNYEGRFVQTRLGRLHNNITQRANPKGKLQNVHHRNYLGVSISDDFKDPQKFCTWVTSQHGWGLRWSLDKDLLVRGNKEYSPTTCSFIPQSINIAIIQPTNSKRTFLTPHKGKFRLVFFLGNKKIVIKGLETEEEALKCYRKYREGYVKKLAVEHENFLSEDVFSALLQWELEIL